MNRVLFILLALLILGPAWATASTVPLPPEQPATGPGGSEAEFDEVRSERFGAAPTGFALFWPRQQEDVEPLPVVIFMHGFSAVNPESYRDWIDHIVRRGAIVIYPDYQTANRIEVPPHDLLPNAIAGIAGAVAMLEGDAPVSADLERVAIVGHSFGGVLTANIAAVAHEATLPIPDAIMLVQPGGCLGCGGLSELLGVPYANLAHIDPDTLALVVAGDEDDVVGATGARLAWEGMTSIPLELRDFVTMRSDHTGQPPLIADHYAPETAGARGEVDALDWFGFWKWFDLLADCAFFEIACANALGATDAQLDMGLWSDGTRVAQPIITDAP